MQMEKVNCRTTSWYLLEFFIPALPHFAVNEFWVTENHYSVQMKFILPDVFSLYLPKSVCCRLYKIPEFLHHWRLTIFKWTHRNFICQRFIICGKLWVRFPQLQQKMRNLGTLKPFIIRISYPKLQKSRWTKGRHKISYDVIDYSFL